MHPYRNIAITFLVVILVSLAALLKSEEAQAITAGPHEQRLAQACDRVSGMSFDVCLGLVRSKMPISWTVDRDLHLLLYKESTWRVWARNPRSGACGLFQFLPCRSFHPELRVTPRAKRQADAGFRYISQRYGSPAAAMRHHRRKGWY